MNHKYKWALNVWCNIQFVSKPILLTAHNNPLKDEKSDLNEFGFGHIKFLLNNVIIQNTKNNEYYIDYEY